MILCRVLVYYAARNHQDLALLKYEFGGLSTGGRGSKAGL
jgi:hypothetical protein